MFQRLVPWMIYAKGREVCEFCLTVENTPGKLKEALEVFARYGINILHISGHAMPEWDRAPIFLFVDVTNKKHYLERIREELELITKGTVRYKLASIKGFMIDEFAFPLCTFPDLRSIVILENDFISMLKGIYERLGDVGKALFFNIACFGGAAMAEYLLKRLKLKGEELIREALKIYQASGWGKMELVSYKPEEPFIVLRLYDSIECKAFVGQKEPASHYIRGHLSGLLSRLMESNMLAIEVKCIAIGDPYCQFNVRRIGEREPSLRFKRI